MIAGTDRPKLFRKERRQNWGFNFMAERGW